ncbi:FecR domain-containing protein [Magnetospira sp. QH-2]|uniref:FecR domain-containing protein n=1 Tax=Magnetospira sp. (strain QH-2) TaxID=1288970 RepID=UPI0003E80E37|nr:FecR domain-containing protein [Magnetospira sp. QH-2]CCQ73524.1 RTX toxins and related Ca2+-binding protein [Magnetospira sp. QH-2]
MERVEQIKAPQNEGPESPAVAMDSASSPDTQIAQTAPLADGQPIGRIDELQGDVIVVRADGTRLTLSEGDPVFQGDILQTGDDAAVGVTLADSSVFSLGASGKMVLDEMVYDPGAEEGSASFSLLTGAATFVSGQIAKLGQDAMMVKTPVATIGIRGTKVYLETDGESIQVVNLPETTLKGDTVGEIVLMTPDGETIGTVNTSGAGWQWTPSEGAPEGIQLTMEQIQALVVEVSENLPRTLEEQVLDKVEELRTAREAAQQAREEADAAREQAQQDASEEAQLLADAAAREAENLEAEAEILAAALREALDDIEALLGYRVDFLSDEEWLFGENDSDDNFEDLLALDDGNGDDANLEDFDTAAGGIPPVLSGGGTTSTDPFGDSLLGVNTDPSDPDGNPTTNVSNPAPIETGNSGGTATGDSDTGGNDDERTDSDDSGTGNTEPTGPVTLAGWVIDGYLDGARVFVDLDRDTEWDEGIEDSTITDELGGFTLITDQTGVLTASGGFNTETQQAFVGTMTAPQGSTIITPLSTLIQSYIDLTDPPVDADTAESFIADALNLDGRDLLDVDPFDGVASGDTTLLASAAMLVNTAIQLQAASPTELTLDGAFDALAELLASLPQSDDQSGSPLTDPASMSSLLEIAGIDDSEGGDLASLLAAANGIVDDLSGDDFLQQLADTNRYLQGELASQIADSDDFSEFEGRGDDLASDIEEHAASQPQTLTGGDGGDVLVGGAGNDLIIGGSGQDRMEGAAGNDLFIISGTDTGFDRVYGGSGFDTISGSDGDDDIGLVALSGVEVIDGGGGNNVIRGNDGVSPLDFSRTTLLNIDSIDGGVGNDVITGSAGDDVIVGGVGTDRLNGFGGDDQFLISGDDGTFDSIAGGNGHDTILGGDGDDVIGLSSVSGVEVIDGGSGINVIRGNDGANRLDFSETTLVNIASIEGGAGNDVLTGSADGDVIVGGAGTDRLLGGDGDDQFLVSGADGSFDSIAGGDGNDTILGGDGDDVIGLSSLSGVEVIDGGSGTNVIRGNDGANRLDFSETTLENIDSIEGGLGNDVVTGSAGDDTIIGGAGNDRLNGGEGNDVYGYLLESIGSDGVDRLTGFGDSDGDDAISLIMGLDQSIESLGLQVEEGHLLDLYSDLGESFLGNFYFAEEAINFDQAFSSMVVGHWEELGVSEEARPGFDEDQSVFVFFHTNASDSVGELWVAQSNGDDSSSYSQLATINSGDGSAVELQASDFLVS